MTPKDGLMVILFRLTLSNDSFGFIDSWHIPAYIDSSPVVNVHIYATLLSISSSQPAKTAHPEDTLTYRDVTIQFRM